MRRTLPAWQIFAPGDLRPRPFTIGVMNNVIINVNWEYFLGMIGTLIALAYYANGRFTRIETSVEWLKDALRSLKIASENGTNKLFDVSSPVSLTTRGRRAL